MLERQPLTTLHNGCFASRKVQRTYGKKSKAPAGIGSNNFFIMSDDLENKMAQLDIVEPEDRDQKTVSVSVQPVNEVALKTAPSKDTKKKTKKAKEEIDLSFLATEMPGDQDATNDERCIMDFTSRVSKWPVLSFTRFGTHIGEGYDIKKVGEGSYSSVFALRMKDADQSSGSRNTIMKMMPILLDSEDECEEEHEGKTATLDIETELKTMEVMDKVHGFIRYRGLLVVKGDWPCNFLEAFREFTNSNKSKAFNKDPEQYSSNQYFALVEMEDAGTEVGDIERPSDFQIYDIFWSTCIQLANAEKQVEFEHRDMHVSNVCVKSIDPSKEYIDIDHSVTSNMQEKPVAVLGLSNISVTLIDYTLSRATLPSTNLNDRNNASNFREITYTAENYEEKRAKYMKQLKESKKPDDWITTAQFWTYHKAAKCVALRHNQALAEEELNRTESDSSETRTETQAVPVHMWSRHVPQTNVCWLSYLIMCLLKRAGKIKRTKYVEGSNDVAMSLQDDIRKGLVAVNKFLDVEPEEMLASAEDVVRVGVEQGWISQADIDAFKARLEKDS